MKAGLYPSPTRGEATVLGVEYICAAQGIEFRAPLPPSGPPVTDIDRAIVTIIPRAVFGDLYGP